MDVILIVSAMMIMTNTMILLLLTPIILKEVRQDARKY